MQIINSILKRFLRLPIAYYFIKTTFLFHIKKVRRAVWLPEFVKVKGSKIIFKSDTSIPRIADLHFLGWKSLKDYFSLSILRKLASKSDVIFDVGADIGIVSLYISDANPFAKIFSFEPSSHSFPVLLNLIKKNKNESIIPVKMAVGAKNSSEIFYYSPVNSVISSLAPRAGFIEEKVNVTTIEFFCRQNKINKIDLIKIDVEGFESEVIAGFGEEITLSRPIIFAEVLNESNGMKIARVLPKDYRFFRIIEENKILREDQKIDRTSNMSNNYLLMPREKLSVLNELKLRTKN